MLQSLLHYISFIVAGRSSLPTHFSGCSIWSGEVVVHADSLGSHTGSGFWRPGKVRVKMIEIPGWSETLG